MPYFHYLAELSLTLALFIISQQQLGQMARLRRTMRKRVAVVRELPAEIVAAIAEVVVTSSLGYGFCFRLIYIYD